MTMLPIPTQAAIIIGATAAFALLLIAVTLVVERAATHRLKRQVRDDLVMARALDSVRQDLEWKTRLVTRQAPRVLRGGKDSTDG